MTLEERKEEIRLRADRYIAQWLKDNNIEIRGPDASPFRDGIFDQFVLDELARLGFWHHERDNRLNDIEKRLKKVEAQVKQLERRKG